MRRALICAALAIATGAATAAQRCDARTEALNLFGRQGLNLLRPARDYIRPGGLVFIPRNSSPEYDDPADPMAPESGNLADFRAVILEETETRSTGFGIALDLVNWVLPAPLGLKMSGEREVSLGGVETTGLRLQTTAVDALLKRPGTAGAAIPELKRGLRVFIVQEVYKATSLDLKATNNQKLNVSFNDGTAVSACSDGGSTPAESKPAAAKPASAAAKPAAGAAATVQLPTPKLGVSVCVDRGFTLKFKTTDPLPFAVRLAELELSDGQLRRRRASSVNTTLGGGEIGAAVVDAQEPAIDNLQRRKR